MELDLYEEIDVFNPTKKPFSKSVEGKTYTIPPRESIKAQRYVARILANHLSDLMTSNDKVITQRARREAVRKIINE